MTRELNYCKNCGARNEWAPSDDGDNRGRRLAIAAASFIGVVGMVGFYPILRELLRSPLPPFGIVAVMFVYVTAVFAMFSVLLGHSKRRLSDIHTTSGGRACQSFYPAASLRPATTAQLEEPRDMPASVTERTTRTLDEVPR